MMINDKSAAILDIIINHILSEREKRDLLPPAPSADLGDSARDTAYWFSGEEDFEDAIEEYLRQRFIERDNGVHSSWILRLLYAKDFWPACATPSEIAEDLIEKAGLSQVARIPQIDYLGIGSTFAFLDKSGAVTEISGGQPDRFGFAIVVAYASDGNYMIVDRINQSRKKAGAAPLRIAAPLRGMARKFMIYSSADKAEEDMWHEAQKLGYVEEGWRVRLCYSGSYARLPNGGAPSITEPEMADIIAEQLVKEWPVLLRPDWQDIGVATAIRNLPVLGGPNFQAEFVVGWKVPFDAPRPANFPPPINPEGRPSTLTGETTRRDKDYELEAFLGPVYQEPTS